MPTRHVLAGLLVGLLTGPPAVFAQTGVLAGTAVDAETGEPLSAAGIEIHGPAAAPVTFAADGQGGFRRQLPAATYFVIVSALGYETKRIDAVTVRDGRVTELRAELRSTALQLNAIVVSASRKQEKALDAPAAVAIVHADAVAGRMVSTSDQHAQALPGVDVATLGLQRTSVVARGFNDTFSTALLILTDYRYANVPSNRLNAFYMVPTTDLDIDRVEVTLGPGSALYGPNATNGVLHIVTKSPIDHPGTSVTLGGGERTVVQTEFRTAHALSERVGVKLSGRYFRGDDWEWTDPVEEQLRSLDPGNPYIGARDFEAARWSGEARIDVRPGPQTEWVTTAGSNVTLNSIEVNGSGRAHAKNWEYHFLQTRLRHGNLFAQGFVNFNDAGDSRFLRTGLPAIDRSRAWSGQVQYQLGLGARTSVIAGADLQHTDTRTGGSITGRYEDDDVVNEIGGYVHSVIRLSDRWEAVGALRMDHHNRLEEPVFSPRAALVFRPHEGHTLRATFNRAFRTPSVLDLFLDLPAGALPITDQIIYTLRAVGVPGEGYTFAQCEGGFNNLCMRVPGLADPVPANAALMWDALIAALAPALAPLLPNPGAAVGTVLRRLDPEGAATGGNPFPLDRVGPADIDPLRPVITNTLEAGYKGLLGGRVLLTGNLYYSRIRDFVGPITVETPNVFFDPATTAAYVTTRLQPLVDAGALRLQDVQQLIGGLVAIPLGTVSPAQWDAPDILLTYRNFGRASLWGFELAGEFAASEGLSVRGSVSYTSENCFDFDDDGACTSAIDRSLNAPSIKGNVVSRYADPRRGFAAEARVRMVDGFPHATGVFVGEVPAYALLDVALNYRLARLPGTSLNLTASNLLDHRHRQMIGAAPIGRLVTMRLRYDF